jgi:hypothetical protein
MGYSLLEIMTGYTGIKHCPSNDTTIRSIVPLNTAEKCKSEIAFNIMFCAFRSALQDVMFLFLHSMFTYCISIPSVLQV